MGRKEGKVYEAEGKEGERERDVKKRWMKVKMRNDC
jgi:hypothetical protein